MTIEFFMPMNPPTCTHQEKQVRISGGKPVFYEPAKLKAARAKLTDYLARHRPDQPFEGAVELWVTWLFKPHNRHQKPGMYRTTKPDTDNLQKLLKDCMTACNFWKDDAQVSVEHIQKRWNDIPGILVEISELYDDE